MPPIDWHGMFVPSVSLFELLIRGSFLYLAIFAFMRVFRRQAGALSMADLLVVVLVADAAQNGMAGEYRSISEGVILVGTIFSWNYALDFLSFRFPALRPILNPPALPLIKDGRVQRQNLRSQLLTRDELMELLHENGVEDPTEVKVAYLEPDGHVSVIRRKPGDSTAPPKKPAAG